MAIKDPETRPVVKNVDIIAPVLSALSAGTRLKYSTENNIQQMPENIALAIM